MGNTKKRNPNKKSDSERNPSNGFSKSELEAMRARAKELKTEAKAKKTKKLGERDIQAAIAEMSDADQKLAKKIHEIASKFEELTPKTWYGMPAYANSSGKVICFYQAASKFDTRYATFGFDAAARLDEGNFWPTSFGLIKITNTEAEIIHKLIKKAIS